MEKTESGFLTLGELFDIIVKGKKIIFLSIILFLIGAIIFLIFTTHKYVVEVHIGPNENALSQYSSQTSFSSLAGAAGLFGGGDNGGDYSKLTDLLTSQLVTRELLHDSRIVKAYFPTVWDEKTAMWIPPSGVKQSVKAFVKETFNRTGWTPPDEKKLADLIKKDFFIGSVGKTQLKKLSYANKDPEIAKIIVMKSLAISDGLIKKVNLRQVLNNISYLEKRLARVSLIEVKKELSSQLVVEEKKRMALESDLPYTYSQIGDVFVDVSPTKPSISGIIFLGLFSGLFFGVFVVFIRHGWVGK